ncbi:hypothetical protein Ndes2526B_g08973 [Nannochloris sp. 'desiccata']|nr:hypothetical protein KSW81_001471 [Chlorella desiccata (nom. nud.)]KAH7616867.1 hypothetical protein NADE_001674 [Chlorella desiccata (nom. nud.)]
MAPSHILPTLAPRIPSSTTAGPTGNDCGTRGNGLPQEEPTLLPSGEILKFNWTTLFPNAPTYVIPPLISTPAAQPLEPSTAAAAMHAVLQSSFRQEHPIKDKARIVLPPLLTGTADTGGDDILNLFYREFPVEDDPVVALPFKEEGRLLNDDEETPPLPPGIDWWSPPKENQYQQEEPDYLGDHMQSAPLPVIAPLAAHVSPIQQSREGVGGQLQQHPPLSPRLSEALAAASFTEYGVHYSNLGQYVYRELFDRVKSRMHP